jgi:two-component system, NtrC family, sensor kinase
VERGTDDPHRGSSPGAREREREGDRSARDEPGRSTPTPGSVPPLDRVPLASARTAGWSAGSGLRLRLVVSLAALFVLGFVPLFFAISGLTRATLRAEREDHARAMGRVVAARVAEAHARRAPGDLSALVEAQIGGRTGLSALAVYDETGRRVAAAGELADLDRLPPRTDGVERVERETTRHGPAVRVTIPGPRGAVVALLRTDDEGTRTEPLLRLVGLYVGVIAVALLVFVYIALGRLVVNPLDRLALAARRVAEGPRPLVDPSASASALSLQLARPAPFAEEAAQGPRETRDLGRSLSAMTSRLEAEETKLRSKVTELERTTAELRATQAGLVRSERLASVGRLSAGLAHEIGNPLAALAGMNELLLEGGLDEQEQRDFLVRTQREIDRIARIVRELLAFARPDQPHDAEEPGDLGAALHDLEKLLAPQKAFRSVHLQLDLPADLPPVALSREHLTQVGLNLLLNAAQACPTGTIRVTARAVDVEGTTTKRGSAGRSGVRWTVEDDGPGISDEVATRLFEPFVTTKPVGEGTGLGLAVCRGLVEGVGGTIELHAEDAPPRAGARAGACFVVWLPAATTPVEASSAVGSGAAGDEALAPKGTDGKADDRQKNR